MLTHSDRELVKAFQAGDQQAFTAFVQRHQDRIYRLACANLYAPEEAADAAQEVFLRAYKGLGRFRFAAEPFTWLFRTVKNVCNEYNRRTQRSNKLVSEIDIEQLAEWEHDDSSRLTDMRQVQSLVSQLPKRQQDVVLLRIFEGMSIEETAQAMDCRPGTVKAHLHKAINRLREIYGQINHTGDR